MKSASTAYRTQIIEGALRLRYQDLVDDIAEQADDVREAVKADSTPAMMAVMSTIARKMHEMDEIHRMLGEKCCWISEPPE